MSEFWTDREHATSFGQAAGSYEQGRPGYPEHAVAWLIGDAARVLDVGAGTGKLTRSLLALGREVTAVEPDPRLREEFATAVPGVAVMDGTGEDLPLADHSVDAVTYGQAWHWVEPKAGCREAARVLRPDGVLGLIWNARDNSVDWVAELTATVHPSAGELMSESALPPFVAPFVHSERAEWRWLREMSRDDVLAMVASRSYVIKCEDAEREDIFARVRVIIDALPTGPISMPYRTVAWRIRR